MPSIETQDVPRCGAKRKYDGAPCQAPAIRGSSRCRLHGGGAPQVRESAARRVTEVATREAAHRYGTPRQVSPLDALEEELARTQGHVDWLAEQVSKNPDPGWLGVYQSERAHLVRLGHQMMQANTDERRTMLAEKSLDRLQAALEGIVRDLGHDSNSERVRAVIARHLRAVLVPDAPEQPDIIDGPDNVVPLPIDF